MGKLNINLRHGLSLTTLENWITQMNLRKGMQKDPAYTEKVKNLWKRSAPTIVEFINGWNALDYNEKLEILNNGGVSPALWFEPLAKSIGIGCLYGNAIVYPQTKISELPTHFFVGPVFKFKPHPDIKSPSQLEEMNPKLIYIIMDLVKHNRREEWDRSELKIKALRIHEDGIPLSRFIGQEFDVNWDSVKSRRIIPLTLFTRTQAFMNWNELPWKLP